MRKIVHNQHSANFPFHIHSPLDAAKRRKRFSQNIRANPASVRHRHRRHRIQHVVPPARRQRELAERFACVRDAEPHSATFDG